MRVGMIGLGIMGSAMADNLLRAGFPVTGYDIVPERVEALVSSGGRGAASCSEAAQWAEVLITSLPSEEALQAVVHGPRGLLAAAAPEQVVLETSTLPLRAKLAAHDALWEKKILLLDCPLSGTGAQARSKDIVVYASGDAAAYERVRHILPGFSRGHHYLGEFGMGTKMKLVANLLVTIHNVAAAEAFVLGMKAGLDPWSIYEAVKDGGGSSRMFEVRGPLMAAGTYDDPTMKVELHQKDIRIITALAEDLRCPTPVFSASAQVYTAALAKGRGLQDTASVCAVLEEMAGLERKAP